MNMDHSAWEGFEIDGHVDTVLSRGKVIVDGGEYLGAKGDGRYLKRGLSQYLT
jgi:dihydropyrimidinase